MIRLLKSGICIVISATLVFSGILPLAPLSHSGMQEAFAEEAPSQQDGGLHDETSDGGGEPSSQYEATQAEGASELLALDSSEDGTFSERDDFLDTDDYKDIFGMSLAEPQSFVSTSEPLEDYVPLEASEIYLAKMNRSSQYSGDFRIMRHADSLASLKIEDNRENDTYGAVTEFKHYNKDGEETSGDNKEKGFEYNTQNAVLLDLDGDGVDDVIFQSVIYTGLHSTNISKKEVSQMQLMVYRQDGNAYVNGPEYHVDLVNSSTEKKNAFNYIETQNSLGLKAMAVGDYDGDGADEVAVYVPSIKTDGDPYIGIFEVSTKDYSITEKQKISLSGLNVGDAQFSFEFKDHLVPLVHLATTHIAGKDELVINASLPMHVKNGYCSKDQRAVIAIYGWGTVDKVQQLVQNFKMPFSDNGANARMRFVQAVDADLNGNGVTELLLGGFKNYGYSSSDKKQVGSLDRNKNLLNILTWNGTTYELVWSTPKEVDAFISSSKNLDEVELQEPAALSAGRYSSKLRNDGCFLEGVVFYFEGYTTTALNEADALRTGSFVKKAQMNVNDAGGSNNAYINTALSGRFVSTVGTEQILIMAGDEYSANTDLIYYDMWWLYEDSAGNLSFHLTDNDYFKRVNEDDGGTFFTLCATNYEEDSVQVKYMGKSMGWSKPTPISLAYGAPYWDDLPYSKETFGAGKTSFTFTSGVSTSHEHETSNGSSFVMGFDLLMGAGIGDTEILGGFGVDFESMTSDINSHAVSNDTLTSYTINVPADEDRVFYMTTPAVVYQYQMMVPSFKVTQDYLDAYYALDNAETLLNDKGNPAVAGDVIPAQTVSFTVTYKSASSFGSATINDYNSMWDAYYDQNNVAEDERPTTNYIIDSTIYPHVTGEPLSYPRNIGEIPGVSSDNGNLLGEHTPLQITTGNATVGFSLELSESVSDTTGTQTEYSAGMQAKEQLSLGVGFKVDQSFSIGGSEIGATRITDVVTTMDGVTFEGEVPYIPAGTGNYDPTDYGYAVGMAVWKPSNTQIPYAVGYYVPDSTADVPPALPLNIHAAAADTTGLMLAWDNPDWTNEFLFDRNSVRKAEEYEIWQQDNLGEYLLVDTLDASETSWVRAGLEPDTAYTYKLRAVRYLNSNPVKSAFSDPITVKTTSNDVPTIIQQPQSVVVSSTGGAAVFTVVAEPAHSQTEQLTYQWQQFIQGAWHELEEGAVYAGVQGPSLTVQADGSAAFDEAEYRVRVSESYKGSLYTSYSYSAHLYQSDDMQIANLSLLPSVGNTLCPILDGQYYCKEGIDLTFKATLDEPVGTEGQSFVCRIYDYTTGEELTDQNVTGSFVSSSSTAEALWNPTIKGSYRCIATFNSKGTIIQSEPLIINVGQANPEVSYFYVSYELGGGTNDASNPRIVTAASAPFTLADPVRKGAVFEGWIDATGAQVPDEIDPALLEENPCYTAQWRLIEYELVYEGVSAEENASNPLMYTVESGALSLNAAARAGYTFEGWYLDAACENQAISTVPSGMVPQEIVESFTPTGQTAPDVGDTLTLYAKWSEPLEYAISYMLLGGNTAGSNPVSYTVVDTITLAAATHPHVGKVFDGWYSDFQLTQHVTIIEAGTTGSLTLWAKWKGDESFDPGLQQDENGVYLIASAEDLAQTAHAVYLFPETYGAASYRLTSPIDCSEASWGLPIGTIASPFQGTFDGNDMPIYGLSLKGDVRFQGDEDNDSDSGDDPLDEDDYVPGGVDEAPGQGLFGVIGGNGIVKNVTLLNVQSSVTLNNAGSLAVLNRGTILYCSNGVYQSLGGVMSDGALVPVQGMSSAIKAKNIAGGLVAINSGRIICSSSSSEVVATEAGGVAGGLVGLNRNDGSLEVVYNTGTVRSIEGMAGGLIGSNTNDGLAYCGYNTGLLEGATLGGIAAVSQNANSGALYYRDESLTACSNQSLSAIAMSYSEMKTEALVNRLLAAVDGRESSVDTKEPSWLRNELINEGLPLIRSFVARLGSQTITLDDGKSVKLTGIMHPDAKLVVVPLEDEVILSNFKEAAGSESTLLAAYDVRIVFSDGTDAPYCGVLSIGFDLSTYELPKNAVPSVYHCVYDGAISKLQGSSDGMWQIGLTKSFSPFALFWQPQVETTPDSDSGGLAQTGDSTGGMLILVGLIALAALALLRMRRYAQ